MSRRSIFAATVALALTAACGSTPTSPSITGATSPVYTGILQPGGTDASITFPVSATNTVALTLGSLALSDGTLASTTVLLGLGTYSGTTCNVLTTASATPGLAAQVTGSLGAGTGCIKVTDTGGLPGPATYAVRVLVGTIPAVDTITVTDTFDNFLAIGGSVSHAFYVNAGTLSVVLSTITTPSPLNLGLGLWDGNVCRLTTSMLLTNDGTTLTEQANAGTYCTKISDPGVLTSTATFVISITHQ